MRAAGGGGERGDQDARRPRRASRPRGETPAGAAFGPARGEDEESWDRPETAEAYRETLSEGRLYQALAGRLVELVDPSPGSRVLDLACGTGLVATRLFARLGPEGALVGVDNARAMLVAARASLAGVDAAFALAEPAALPLASSSLDAAFVSAAFWHFPHPRAALGELARVLRPGGRLAFNVPAAQLEDVADLPPHPLMVALAREGERRFGAPPAAAGPARREARLVEDAAECGLALACRALDDHAVDAGELARLMELPVFSARLYPRASAAERAAWVAAASARIEPGEEAPVRWVSLLFERSVP